MGMSTNWISVKPSARRSSSPTYNGATQIPGALPNRTVVVSRGPSWADVWVAPITLAAPADASLARKRRLFSTVFMLWFSWTSAFRAIAACARLPWPERHVLTKNLNRSESDPEAHEGGAFGLTRAYISLAIIARNPQLSGLTLADARRALGGVISTALIALR